MYAANHYVSVNGVMYMKDEAIQEEMTPEKIKWLLDAGAIREIRPPKGQADAGQEELPGLPEEGTGSRNAGYGEEEAGEEIEGEAPEIDVMAGIVQDAPKEAEKQPVRKRRGGKGK